MFVFSRPNAIQIIDPELEANYVRTKKPTEPLPLTELQKMMITVSYEYFFHFFLSKIENSDAFAVPALSVLFVR